MSSEIITSNDLKAILDEVLPSCAVDYVVEQGTSGIWTYRKWYSGIAECWGEYYVSSASYSSWGSIYSLDVLGVAYPTGLFNAKPLCVAQAHCAGGNSVSSINSSEGTSTTSPAVTVIRGTTTSATAVYVIYQAKGTWK